MSRWVLIISSLSAEPGEHLLDEREEVHLTREACDWARGSLALVREIVVDAYCVPEAAPVPRAGNARFRHQFAEARR